MIQRKKKICSGCGELKFIFSKGKCDFCASKTFKPIKPTTKGIKSKPKPKENKDELNQFFDKHIAILVANPYSITGEKIFSPSRLNIAHLLPKRNHKSIATLDENVVYLTWQEHTSFDYLLDCHKFSEIENKFPKVWILLKKVLPLVEERTKLVNALNNYIGND